MYFPNELHILDTYSNYTTAQQYKSKHNSSWQITQVTLKLRLNVIIMEDTVLFGGRLDGSSMG